MPIYKIRGIDVDFPFEAYDCQIAYMEKVIQSLQEGCNALLESPTGTGKTLCLLCATLAWRRTLGEFSAKVYSGSQPSVGSQSSQEHPGPAHPVIIYASRTHSQLKQVIRELKRTNFRPRMAILGSREQMCIHDEVKLLRGKSQNNACQHLCKRRSCRHHTRVSEYMKNHQELGNEPFDIEDLVTIGRTQGPCPYYISRELHKIVDILFTPYNYLIDRGNRRSLSGIRWSNSILIFDEAHNLESICADAASFDLPCSYLNACISEAKECVDICVAKKRLQNSNESRFDPENYELLKVLLMALKKKVTEISIESEDLGLTRPGDYMYKFLEELNITHKTASILIDTIEDAAVLLQEENVGKNQRSNSSGGIICRLENIKDILSMIFNDGSQRLAKFYRFHVQDTRKSPSDMLTGESARTLSWWCFNPGIAMEEFIRLGVRSIILTSGTLSPMESFALELNLHFPVRLENPHCVSSSQVWVGVVPTGPSGYSFNSSFRNRDSLEYKQDLGNAVVNFARIVPDGVLVFFPSYYFMDQCMVCWKNKTHASAMDSSTIWERICRYKQPVVEPKQSALFPHAIKDFQAKLHDCSTSGAIFFAVCRGKVSEGLDFADQAGRAVLIIGIPFSVKTDPKVRLKREYLDQQSLTGNKDRKVLTGEEWYVQQASRAVNQAVGRVIRHRHDYGAILLCDERFAYKNHQSQMSFWLRPYIKSYTNFGDVVFTMTRFFRDKVTSSKREAVEDFSKLKDKQSHETLLTLKGSPFHQFKSTRPCSKLDEISTSELHQTESPSPLLSNIRGGIYDMMDKITPSNRSTLSSDRIPPPCGQLRDPVTFQKSLQSNQCREKSSDDDGIIDLTDDILMQSDTTSNKMPTSIKRPKLVIESPETVKAGNDSFSKLHNIKLGHKRQKHFSCSTLATNCDQLSEFVSCGPVENGKNELDGSRVDILMCSTSTCGSNVMGEKSFTDLPNQSKAFDQTPLPKGGSAFLAQVKEKLSIEEFTEFLSHMKALKSKPMMAMPAFESIANLFSSPERLFLFERFKDLVPERFRPFYERYLRACSTADASE